MAELHLGGEHGGARADAPGHHGLSDLALLDGLGKLVLLNTTNLAKQDEHLAAVVVLVAAQMVHEGRAGVAVTANGNALKHTVGVAGNDVVELVGHATRPRHIGHRAGAIQLGRDDVVHHAASVADAEAAGLDATHCGRPDDDDVLLLGHLDDLAGAVLRDTLGNDGNHLDLGELHGLNGGVVGRAEGGKVDHHIDLGILLQGRADVGVDGDQHLLGAPVELLHVEAPERVDHGGHRGCLAAAQVVKVQHALHGTSLHAVDNAACVLGEQHVGRSHLGGLGLGGGSVCCALLALAGHRVVTAVKETTAKALILESSFGVRLGDAHGHGTDGRHVGLGPVDLDGDRHLGIQLTHHAQTLLVVGPGTAHIDLGIDGLELGIKLTQGLDQTLECGRNVGKVCNAATNDQQLGPPLGISLASHEGEQSLGILVCLRLTGCTGVLAVVGKLVRASKVADGVGVDHGGTATGDHGPDAPLGVENSELERSTTL
eukprot:comp19635_c0_seq1/m.23182 comp19635_c0_seq1/g.23182  ORF comp19635_c0_seq1/g.23182 comp19635_c0_seq1/m.23182 type:complete len:487 (+) comp19635_c0_seq1:1309-2769(+)